jgi:hypothetical protein
MIPIWAKNHKIEKEKKKKHCGERVSGSFLAISPKSEYDLFTRSVSQNPGLSRVAPTTGGYWVPQTKGKAWAYCSARFKHYARKSWKKRFHENIIISWNKPSSTKRSILPRNIASPHLLECVRNRPSAQKIHVRKTHLFSHMPLNIASFSSVQHVLNRLKLK